MLDTQKIKSTLEYARLWEYDLTVFGSNGHLYCLNTPLDEEALSAWEAKHSLSLPQDYRDYLTKLGNGFAGPGYGIPPFSLELFQPAWKKPCLHAPEHAEEFDHLAHAIAEWYDMEEDEDGEEDDQEEALYDAWSERFNCDGVLALGTNGCEGINGLALNGSTRGFYLSLSSELEYYRSGELGIHNKPFTVWVTEWLETVEQACSQLTQTQLDRSKWEREWMLQFTEFWQKKDGAEMERLVSEIEKRDSISTKCAGFLYYFSPRKRRHLPGAEHVAQMDLLRARMGNAAERQRYRLLPHIICPGDTKYAVAWNPTLEDFAAHL